MWNQLALECVRRVQACVIIGELIYSDGRIFGSYCVQLGSTGAILGEWPVCVFLLSCVWWHMIRGKSS